MPRASTNGMSFISGEDQVADQRMHGAAVRAISSYQSVRAKAERLCEEMDDLTPVNGVPTSNLSDEDSVVTSIASVIASHSKG